jgi:hypothetical protein
VPPWEDLHEMSRAELKLANLVTTDVAADVLPQTEISVPVAEVAPKVQDRFASGAPESTAAQSPAKSTKTAEAVVPTGGVAAPAQ